MAVESDCELTRMNSGNCSKNWSRSEGPRRRSGGGCGEKDGVGLWKDLVSMTRKYILDEERTLEMRTDTVEYNGGILDL